MIKWKSTISDQVRKNVPRGEWDNNYVVLKTIMLEDTEPED